MIPYGKLNINQEDIVAVHKIMESDYLTQGPITPKFEKELSNYCGEKKRISQARTVCKKNSVLVSDEAINTLDKKKEVKIFKIICELSNISKFFITQDIQNLFGWDEIYELKNETLNQVDVT